MSHCYYCNNQFPSACYQIPNYMGPCPIIVDMVNLFRQIDYRGESITFNIRHCATCPPPCCNKCGGQFNDLYFWAEFREDVLPHQYTCYNCLSDEKKYIIEKIRNAAEKSVESEHQFMDMFGGSSDDLCNAFNMSVEL